MVFRVRCEIGDVFAEIWGFGYFYHSSTDLWFEIDTFDELWSNLQAITHMTCQEIGELFVSEPGWWQLISSLLL